jgi:membrane protease YdiL (CAAX protease family)
VALLGPAAAAFVTALTCGGNELQELRARVVHWRVSPRWYLIALLLPLPVSLLSTALQSALGATGPIALAPLSWLAVVVFVMVVGEEIGWRGFALPKLQNALGPIGASITIGVIWAMWHLPLFYMTSMPQYGSPFFAYMLYTIGLSAILTWLAIHTAGSVVIATLFHGAVNTFIVVNESATPVQKGWGNAVAFGIVGAFLAARAWTRPPNVRNLN